MPVSESFPLSSLPTVDTGLGFLMVSSVALRADGRIYLGRGCEKGVRDALIHQKMCRKKGLIVRAKIKAERSNI